MKKIVILIMFLILSSRGVYAEIKGYSMGGIDTVISDGFIDVARNPALMSRSRYGGSYGIGATYGVYQQQNVDTEIIQPMHLSQETSGDLKYDGSILAGFSKNMGPYSFGIVLTPGEGHFYKNEIETTIATTAGVSFKENSVETEKRNNPVLTIGWAYKFSGKNSLGISLQSGYYHSKKETRVNSPTTGNWSSEKLEIKRFDFELRAGYLLYDYRSKTQVGLMVSAGKFRYEKESLQFESYYDGTANYYDGGGELSYKMTYVEYPSLVFGVKHRVDENIDLALEAGLRMAYEYDEEALDYDDDTEPGLIKTNHSTIDSKYLYIFRSGINFKVSSRLNLLLGANYYIFYNTSEQDSAGGVKAMGETKAKVYGATLGLEYDLTHRSALSFISSYSHTSFDASSELPGVVELSNSIILNSFDMGLLITSYY